MAPRPPPTPPASRRPSRRSMKAARPPCMRLGRRRGAGRRPRRAPDVSRVLCYQTAAPTSALASRMKSPPIAPRWRLRARHVHLWPGRPFQRGADDRHARAGGGNGYYGQTAADLMGPFSRRSTSSRPSTRAVPCSNWPRLPASASRWPTTWRASAPPGASPTWPMAPKRGRSFACAFRRRWRSSRRDRAPHRLPPLRSRHVGAHKAGLAAMPASAFAQLAEDELVARRAQEVSFAAHQRDAAAAACIGDWSRVETVSNRPREAAGNAWLTNSLGPSKNTRRCATAKFTKESTYKAARMMTRLAARDETHVYAAMSEAAPRASSAAAPRREGGARPGRTGAPAHTG